MDKGTAVFLTGMVMLFFSVLCAVASTSVFFAITSILFGLLGVTLCLVGWLTD